MILLFVLGGMRARPDDRMVVDDDDEDEDDDDGCEQEDDDDVDGRSTSFGSRRDCFCC